MAVSVREKRCPTKFGGLIVEGGVASAILNAVVAEDLPGPGTVFLSPISLSLPT
jgi:hypothetical protein